jgi:uracil-DNA glycosylase
VDASWKFALASEFEKPYFKALLAFVKQERAKGIVYPPSGFVFTAFNVTPLNAVRVLILGQDPYHRPNQAHGLSFSVLPGTLAPPSLQNIYKELQDDLGIPIPTHGYLIKWAQQGIFLLNSVLTVRAHEPGSHQGQGWEKFTDFVIQLLSDRNQPIVFVLWGKYARDKVSLINTQRHVVIESAHPSPMSAHNGFFGNKPFSKVNAVLERFGSKPIDWKIT